MLGGEGGGGGGVKLPPQNLETGLEAWKCNFLFRYGPEIQGLK